MSGALTREKLVIPQEVGERLPNNLIMLGMTWCSCAAQSGCG